MLCLQTHQEVARLDGYLDGITAFTNHSRRYSAGAFVIDSAEFDACIEQAIKDYKKSWCPELAFDHGSGRIATRAKELGVRYPAVSAQ